MINLKLSNFYIKCQLSHHVTIIKIMTKRIKLKNIIIITCLLTIFSIIIFSKTLFNGEVFAWYNDQLFQHNVFYKEWYQIIKESINNHTLSVYSWNTFLGTDYLASKLMYCVGDFLITPFFIFYNGEINYDLLFAITTIITIVLSGINMYVYLDKYGIKKQYLLIPFPIVYALGGFALTYTGSYVFHRFYALLPLLFYFCEIYIQDNKRAGFSFIVALLFMQSYELLFSTCFFLVLYFIHTYKLRYQYKLSIILKKAVFLIISFIVGVLLCGIFLIPLIFFLKNNTRVASFKFDNIFWSFKIIVGFITSMIIPAFNYRSSKPAYLFYGDDHYGSEYGLFVSVLFILAIIVLIKKGNKNEKKLWLIGEGLILICLLFRPLNSIVHGFSVPSFRWCFLLEFYHLMLILYVFEKYELKEYYFKSINIAYACYLLLYIVFIVVYKIDVKEYYLAFIINIFSFALLYVYSFLLNRNNKIFFSSFLIGNIMLMYFLSIYATYGIYGKGDVSYNNEYLSYFIDNDEDNMFRIYFDSDELWPYSWLNLNDSLNNNYMSTTTYDSTYDSTLNPFLNLNAYDSWMIDINDIKQLRFLGTKYYITSSKLEDEDNFEYCTNVDNFNVYKILNYNHIGYTVSNFVKEDDISEFNEDITIIKDNDYELISNIKDSDKKQLEVIEYNRQYMKGSIKVDDDSLLFVSIPYSTGWNIVDQSGRKLTTLNINGGFLGILIDENVDELYFYYGTPGLKTGCFISLFAFFAFILIVIEDIKIKNTLYNEMNDGVI